MKEGLIAKDRVKMHGSVCSPHQRFLVEGKALRICKAAEAEMRAADFPLSEFR